MSGEFGFEALSLQSGFVVAVLIAAVLLAERLGGDEVLARRGIQVVIGVALTLVVLAGTTAFIRSPETPDATFFESISGGDSERAQEELQSFVRDSAQRASEAGSVHVGLGIVFALLGGIMLGRMKAIPPGLLLGGMRFFSWVRVRADRISSTSSPPSTGHPSVVETPDRRATSFGSSRSY